MITDARTDSQKTECLHRSNDGGSTKHDINLELDLGIELASFFTFK